MPVFIHNIFSDGFNMEKAINTDSRPKLGDIYATQLAAENKWVLYQVIQLKDAETNNYVGAMKDTVAILGLDWYAENLPTQVELARLKPLIINHHSWDDHYDVRYPMDPIPPQQYRHIGNLDPVVDIAVNTYGDWPVVHAITRQYEWLEYPEADRLAYKQAIKSDHKVMVNGQERRESSTSIFLDQDDEPIRWQDLQKLPALNSINYTGTDTQVISYCSTKNILSKLHWEKHHQSTIDLGKTHLRELIVDITGLKELTIPDSVKFLSLIGDYNHLKSLDIKQPNQGMFLELHLHYLKDFPIPQFALPQLKKLSMRISNTDIELIVKFYPNISILHIWSNPGFIENIHALKELVNINDIQFNDVFGYTAHDFPTDLPAIDRIWLTSVPEDVGQCVKKAFKHISNLNISKLRKEPWLKANLDNPFRAWDGREGTSSAKAKKAFDAYKNACTQIDKLNKEISSTTEEQKIIAAFVEVFNKMERKGGIETIEREEIFDVFNLLQDKMNISRNTYAEYFDSLREF